jgi:hypothetical protein
LPLQFIAVIVTAFRRATQIRPFPLDKWPLTNDAVDNRIAEYPIVQSALPPQFNVVFLPAKLRGVFQ